jgi:hypothetical protein
MERNSKPDIPGILKSERMISGKVSPKDLQGNKAVLCGPNRIPKAADDLCCRFQHQGIVVHNQNATLEESG